jgi:hypothetical protein
MDIDCVSLQTNAPTDVGTSQKHKVHMTLSLHKSGIHAKNSSNVCIETKFKHIQHASTFI